MNTATVFVVSPKALRVINMVREAIQKSPTKVSFFSIKGYRNKEGELANYVFNIGVSYAKAKEKDLEYLRNLDITKEVWDSPLTLIEQARTKLINSLIKPSEAHSEGQKEAYTVITEGVKVHNETGALYIYGYRVSKTVIEAVDYGADTRRALTKAQDELKKGMKSTKYRQFIVSEAKEVKGGGETIEINC